MSYEHIVAAVKYLMGAGAAVAAFLLINDIPSPWDIVLGAYIVLAAYVNPETVASPIAGHMPGR